MSYLIVHKELYGVLITGVCPVQLKGEIDVVPHVVLTGHVVCKALGKEYWKEYILNSIMLHC